MRIRLESPASKLAVSLAVFGLLFPYSWLSWSRYKAASLAQLDDRASLERAVIGRMPIARRDHEPEAIGDRVDRRRDFVPVLDGQRPAGREVVLEVDHEQSVHDQ